MHYNRYNQGQYRDDHWQSQGYNNNMPNWQRRISMVEAMNIALEQVPGQVVKIELDTKKGVLVYEVDIITSQGVKYEVVIDVDTGRIIEIELD